MIHPTDVVIIGAGPVGLFAIFECGMLKLKCHVIDTLDIVGGQCAALYPEKPIYDIPAHPCIEGGALIDNLKQQAAPFDPVYHLSQQVLELKEAPHPTGVMGWQITTSAGTQLLTRAVIIAAGVGAFGPHRPPLEGLEIYENKSIFYYVKRKEDFRGKRVVIAGGGDSAVDWALSLVDIAQRVSVVHRRAKFRAAPESEAKLHTLAKDGRLDLVIPFQLHGLKGIDGILEEVQVSDLDGKIQEIPADVLLPFYGLSMNLGPIAEWGLSMTHNHISVNHATSGTNARGVYAIGDIANYDGKLKLILTGFAEAATAAHAIRKLLYPEEIIHFEYSTTQGVPGAKKLS